MTSDRIKEIHEATAYPESTSVKQALLQVWNECEQEKNVFFEEIVIMESDGSVLKSLQKVDHIPRTNNFIYIHGNRYQVTSNVYDYDLLCIKIYVAKID